MKHPFLAVGAFTLLLLPVTSAVAPVGNPPTSVEIPNFFESGTPALASEVNQNFGAIQNWANGVAQNLQNLNSANNPADSDKLLQVGEDGGELLSVTEALEVAGFLASNGNKRVVVELLPGTYSASVPITVPENVTLRGSGREATELRVSANQAIRLSDGAQLADLSLHVDHTASSVVGVYVQGSGQDGVVENVRILDPTLNNGALFFAFESRFGSLEVRRSIFEPTGSYGGTSARALTGGTLILDGCDIGATVTGASSTNSKLFIRNSRIDSGQGNSVLAVGPGTLVEVEGSVLDGSSGFGPAGVSSDSMGEFRIATSRLMGSLSGVPTYVHCYDDDFQPISNG